MNFQAELHIRNFGNKSDLTESDILDDIFLLKRFPKKLRLAERVKGFYFGSKVGLQTWMSYAMETATIKMVDLKASVGPKCVELVVADMPTCSYASKPPCS